MEAFFRSFRVFLIVLLVSLFSCKRDEPLVVDKKLGYFPIKEGSYIIYNVDSIKYDNFFDPVKIDTSHYQLKATIGAEYIDNQGRINHEVTISRRDADTSVWHYLKTNLILLNGNNAEIVEDNFRFISLNFPPLKGKSWKGNAYISFTDDLGCDYLGDWDYEYTVVDKSESIDGVDFDSVLTVTQVDEENVICKNVSIEKYAKNVGLVYKKQVRLTTQDANVAIPFEQRAERGHILEKKVVEYNILD